VRGFPHLHDFFCSILDYDAERVHSLLKKQKEFARSKLIQRYHIVYKRKELPVYHWKDEKRRYPTFADVVWILRRNDNRTTAAIIHEVKTGAYDIEEVFRKYNDRVARTSRYHPLRHDIMIWAWLEQHKKNLKRASEDTLRAIRNGKIRLVPLELLIPLATERINQMDKIFQENLKEIDPTEDHLQEIKNTFWEQRKIWAWEKVVPNVPNIIIEYSYKANDSFTPDEEEKIGRDVIYEVNGEGNLVFPPSVLGGRLENAYVPITCTKCYRTYLLPVNVERIALEDREMEPEYLLAITYEGECPLCGNTLELEIEAYEYPLGIINTINVITLEGARFPTEGEVNSKRMGY